MTIYTLLILDFDGTFDSEPDDSYEMEPLVYQIKAGEQLRAQHCAMKASSTFNNPKNDDWDTPIAELFERYMEEENLFYRLVGELHVTFGERQESYLPDYIPRVIV